MAVANGNGIDFSATADNTAQSSSMASELLDDYEEGTWTPSYSVTTTAGDLGYHSRQGSYIKIGNQKDAGYLFGKIGTIFLHMLIALWGVIVFWVPIIMKVKVGDNFLIGKEFWASELIVSLIFLSYLFYAGYIVLMPSIYILKKQNWSPIFRGIGALINISLNLICIKYWGLIGAALATLFAYITMFFFILYKSKNWLKIKIIL